MPDGVYHGVTYAGRSDSFWVTRNLPGESVLEQWSRDGKHLSTSANLPAAALAVDPRDGTLWAIRPSSGAVMRLENFDSSGHHLASLDVNWPHPFLQADGAEFEWIGSR